MTLMQTLGVIVLVAVVVRVLWFVVPAILYARHEAQAERRRSALNRFIKDDYQREAQIARLRALQKPDGDAA